MGQGLPVQAVHGFAPGAPGCYWALPPVGLTISMAPAAFSLVPRSAPCSAESWVGGGGGGGGGGGVVWGGYCVPSPSPYVLFVYVRLFPVILYSLLVIYSLYTCIPTLYGWYFSHFLWPLLPALQLYPCWLSHKEDLRSPVLYQALRLGCSMLAAAIAYRPHIR